jgi:formate dehydrogenase iron-sulfur subunit
MVNREMELAELPQESDPPRGLLSSIAQRLFGPFRKGVPPAPQPATGFYTDTTVCIGCKACEVACKQWNQLPADGFHWSGNSYDNTEMLSATSWRHVKFIEQLSATPAPPSAGEGSPSNGARLSLGVVPDGPSENRWLMMSDVCKHCVAAPCQQACPTGALIHTEFSNVYIQPDICNGCAYCVAACPFGVITRSTFDGLAHKCTLCYDRQRDGLVPACAKACPTQSIQFGPIDELRERARGRVAELHKRGVGTAYLYGDTPTATYSELNSFYLLVDRPAVYGLPDHPFNPWLHMMGDYVRALVSGLAMVAILIVMLLIMGR